MTGRVRCLRADLQSAPGRLRENARPVLRPACDHVVGLGQAGAGNAGASAASQEERLELNGGVGSPLEEPRRDADRRARCVERAPLPMKRLIATCVCRRSASLSFRRSFLCYCRHEARRAIAIQTTRQSVWKGSSIEFPIGLSGRCSSTARRSSGANAPREHFPFFRPRTKCGGGGPPKGRWRGHAAPRSVVVACAPPTALRAVPPPRSAGRDRRRVATAT
jgi:hypothetical protein